jgi:hypothetical protein
MDDQHWQDVDKEILKNLITVPQDLSKTMAIITVTVIAIYIALLGKIIDKPQIPHSALLITGILLPLLLFIVAALIFGRSYLPNRIALVFPEEQESDDKPGGDAPHVEKTVPKKVEVRQRIERYEKHIRKYLYLGLGLFWAGVFCGLFVLSYYLTS